MMSSGLLSRGAVGLVQRRGLSSQFMKVWGKKLRPGVHDEVKPRTQEFFKSMLEGYDWKTYREDFRKPRRKGRSIVCDLRREEVVKRTTYEIPAFEAGDSVEMTILYELGEEKKQTVRGLVIARNNKGADSGVVLYCVVANTAHVRRIPLYSPLVQDMKILQKRFLHKGMKRVRRAKLYYLIDQQKSIRAP